MLDAIWFCGTWLADSLFFFWGCHFFFRKISPLTQTRFIDAILPSRCLWTSVFLDGRWNLKWMETIRQQIRNRPNESSTNFSPYLAELSRWFLNLSDCEWVWMCALVYVVSCECVYMIGFANSYEFHIMSLSLWLVFIFIVHCRKYYCLFFLSTAFLSLHIFTHSFFLTHTQTSDEIHTKEH